MTMLQLELHGVQNYVQNVRSHFGLEQRFGVQELLPTRFRGGVALEAFGAVSGRWRFFEDFFFGLALLSRFSSSC